ncbi:hypothetical protein AVEN_96859-1, partial [Araneus ventricosus]
YREYPAYKHYHVKTLSIECLNDWNSLDFNPSRTGNILEHSDDRFERFLRHAHRTYREYPAYKHYHVKTLIIECLNDWNSLDFKPSRTGNILEHSDDRFERFLRHAHRIYREYPAYKHFQVKTLIIECLSD